MKSNNSFFSYLILISLLCVTFFISPRVDKPTPTEYIQKKKNKKKFKQDRKQWIENMHRAAPNVDWREVDRQNRKRKNDMLIDKRNNLIKNNNLKSLLDNFEIIVPRSIEGNWIERGSNNLAGRIRTADIDFNESIIYCASSGGNIWKGTINGENWESLNDYMQILGITFLRIVNTDNGKRLLVGSENNGFYYSDNEGLSFIEAEGFSINNIKRFIIQSETNHIYALVNSSPTAIYKSIDLGETFELVLSLDGSSGIPSDNISNFDIFTPRYFEDYIYLINNMTLYRISENNLTIISNLPGSYYGDVLLTGGVGNNGTFLYAYVGGNIFKSINGGQTWSNKGEAPSSWWWINGFNSSNLERDKIYIGGMELYKSSSGADEWELVNPWWEYYDNVESKLHADIPEIRFYLDQEYNEIALISTDGGLYISDDYLSSVQNISLSGLGVSQYYSTYSQRFYPYQIFAGSQDQGLQKSITNSNEVQDFEQIISGDYGHLVSGNNGIGIWTNYPGFTIYYPDISNSNSSMSLDFPGSGYLWIAPLMADPFDSDKAFLGGGGFSGNHLVELSLEGNQITYNVNPFNFVSTISAMSYSPIDPSYRYVLTENGKFYFSTDNGENWELNLSFTGPDAHYFYGSTIWPSQTQLGKVYIGGSGYSNPAVYYSENHGESFTAINNGLPNTLVYQLSGPPNDVIVFAATELGPYAYLVNENEWYLLSGDSAPDQTYWSVDFIPNINTARFGTYGRGIWDFVLNDNYELNLGDINQDNIINVQDIILAINFILELFIPSDEEFTLCDLNDDGLINILDIVLIVDIIFES